MAFMNYNSQLQQLENKHLTISNKEKAKNMLHKYGYFSLINGYKSLFKDPTTRNYCDGTTFDNIVALYQFDEQLRELTFRYLLHIERHIRSCLSYAFCDVYGDSQVAYLDRSNYNLSIPRQAPEVDKLINKYLFPLIDHHSDYPYIEHYKQKYHNVPLWVLVNALSFGTLSKMYDYTKPRIQSVVSKEFEGINETQLRQFLKVLTDFRNVCAHGERLFTYRCSRHDIPNLPMHAKLRIPKNGQEYIFGKRDYFSVVLSFRYLLPNEEFLSYKKQLMNLLIEISHRNPQISLSRLLDVMGMPANWKKISACKKF